MMLIKFKKPDPRAGQTVRMDSSRGRHFVGIGSADQVGEQPAGDQQQPKQTEQPQQPAQADARAGKKPRKPRAGS